MGYFKDDIINKITVSAFTCQGDPLKAKSIIEKIMQYEKPVDEEISLIMEKMVFIALDNPKKFKQLASILVKKIKNG
jgi:DNA gyrase inhibitor GyrI